MGLRIEDMSLSRVASILFALLFFLTPAFAGEYNLVIANAPVMIDGQTRTAITINGQNPGPVLRFSEGEDVVVNVRNDTHEMTSVHWHGLLAPAAMDGAPGFNGFPGIAAGATFSYRFTVRQSGAYWYHSHSGLQEQRGLYGPIVVTPARPPAAHADRDYVVFLSDVAREAPEAILNNLKTHSGYYNFHRRTVGDFFRDVRTFGLGDTVADRMSWGQMRMDPTDLSDITGYTFLINGHSPADNETFQFYGGERVRLRLIDGGAMSIFDFRIPGLRLTVVAADGRDIEPVEVDELRIGPGETYDVIVSPQGEQAYTVYAESIDRTGYARATLAPREGMTGPIPAMRPRAVLTMADLGMEDMGPMGGMSGMDHGAMDHDAMADMPEHSMAGLGANGGVDGSGRTFGWGSEAPADARVLNYADLRSLEPRAAQPAATREITMRLGGNMERYIWTINGETMDRAQPIEVRYGERVRITFVNQTMMAHPMHLHGRFVELDNGQTADRLPDKHTLIIPPGQSVSVLLTANELGQWPLHCHLLFHMASGMMTSLVVADAGTPATPPHGGHH